MNNMLSLQGSTTCWDNGRHWVEVAIPITDPEAHFLVAPSRGLKKTTQHFLPVLYFLSSENAKSNSLHLSFTRLCVPPDNRTEPLCGFYSLADVQAVTLHFIIIGRSHLRERESMARGLGRGRERQTGWLGGVWREEAEEGRGGWQRSWLESEDGGGGGERAHRGKKDGKKERKTESL